MHDQISISPCYDGDQDQYMDFSGLYVPSASPKVCIARKKAYKNNYTWHTWASDEILLDLWLQAIDLVISLSVTMLQANFFSRKAIEPSVSVLIA